MQEENANKIQYVYKAMVVLHICNRILGIPSPGYPGNKNQILMLIKFRVVYNIIVGVDFKNDLLRSTYHMLLSRLV